jgi:hypothetical protein
MPEICTQRNDRLGYLGANAAEQRLRAKQPRALRSLKQRLSDSRIDRTNTSNIEHDRVRVLRGDFFEQLLLNCFHAPAIQMTYQRHNQQPRAD